MQKSGAVARFTKILDRGGNLTPSPNQQTYIEKPIHNMVKFFSIFNSIDSYALFYYQFPQIYTLHKSYISQT